MMCEIMSYPKKTEVFDSFNDFRVEGCKDFGVKLLPSVDVTQGVAIVVPYGYMSDDMSVQLATISFLIICTIKTLIISQNFVLLIALIATIDFMPLSADIYTTFSLSSVCIQFIK